MGEIKILIVEDEILISHEIKQCVEKYGYMVCGIVDSGEKAIEMVWAENPDIILMDINLEGNMDGIQAAIEIKSRIEVPVIFLTVSNDIETLSRAKKTEPYGYINKPVKDIEIFTTLETALYKFNAEQKIKENERWSSALLKGIGEGIISVDIDGVITYMNKVAEQMTGWSVNEAIGKFKNEIFFKKTGSSIRRQVKLGDSSNDILLVMMEDYVLQTRYGQEFPVDINNSTILDEKGNVTGSVYSIRDITERRKQEELITRAAEEWRVTFDSLTDAIFLVNEDGDVARCNKAALELVGHSYNEILEVRINQLFDHVGDYIYSCFLDIKKTEHTRIFEQRIKDKWFSGKFDPIFNINDKGDRIFNGAVIILSDVTEKKQAEEEIEQYKNHLEEIVEQRTKELKNANKDLENEISLRWLIAEQMVQMKEFAEAASKSKSEFLANMSHELRTPLNSIIGFAKLLKMGIDPEDTTLYLANIISSGEHLLSMINDILDLSKMEAGKLKIEKDKMNIVTLVSISVDIVSVQAEEKKISVSILKEFPEESLSVYGDQKRLQQVLLNLLSNAIKFTNPEGKISIKIRKNMRTCFVDVQDTGIGIDKSQQQAIFDKFNQVDNSLNKNTQGTGLGLAISKSIVESHNGHLYLASKLGEGSTFTFSIPLYNAKRHDNLFVEGKEYYPERIKQKHILLVVTNEKIIPNAVAFFTNHNQPYNIIKRSSLTSENLKNPDIGAIIIETAENVANEKQVVETVKKLSKSPVVAISNTQDFEYKEIFLSMGYDLFYLIPVDFVDIIKDINDIIGE